MSANSSIEWTDRTWNPLTGCTKVSPGCDHCYAKTMHERFNGPGSFDTITLHPDRLRQPLGWRKPSRVFVNSMSDLFHQDVPNDYIARVFAVMALAPRHTFQVLTKRHARMRSLLTAPMFRRRMYDALVSLDYEWISANQLPWPLPNVWLGVSVEDQKWADIRIPALLDTPAAVRFLSCEPLLGPVDLGRTTYALPRPLCDECERDMEAPMCSECYRAFKSPHVDWVIVGGESGRGARPMHPDWARSLRDQCVAAGVPFLFKQWGEYVTYPQMTEAAMIAWDAKHGNELYNDAVQWRMGKRLASRLLDGRTWDEYPHTAGPAREAVQA